MKPVVFVIGLLFAMSAHAGIIHQTYNTLLPESNSYGFDFDNDSYVELYTAERSGSEGWAFIKQGSRLTKLGDRFVSMGTIDDSFGFISSSWNSFYLDIGKNFFGFKGLTSCHNCFGWAQFNYDGNSLFLTDVAYETSGAGILVGDTGRPVTAVPEPTTWALLILAGFYLTVFRQTKRHNL